MGRRGHPPCAEKARSRRRAARGACQRLELPRHPPGLTLMRASQLREGSKSVELGSKSIRSLRVSRDMRCLTPMLRPTSRRGESRVQHAIQDSKLTNGVIGCHGHLVWCPPLADDFSLPGRQTSSGAPQQPPASRPAARRRCAAIRGASPQASPRALGRRARLLNRRDTSERAR
jgi:hypothetical protein